MVKRGFTPVSKRWLTNYHFSGVNCNLLNECKIKQYIDLVQKKHISHWNHTLQHSQKLNFCYKIKTNYSPPPAYLDLTRNNPSMKTLVKLRTSSHKLRIETGRYDNIPRDERLCSLCNCNRTESESRVGRSGSQSERRIRNSFFLPARGFSQVINRAVTYYTYSMPGTIIPFTTTRILLLCKSRN